ASIELASDGGIVFDVPLDPVARADMSPLGFTIPANAARPQLARVRFQDRRRSGAAVVACIGELRSETRELLGSRGEKAATALDDAQEEGLWLLEILDDLEAVDRGAMPQALTNAMVPRGPRVTERGTEQSQMLDYVAFLAGRRRRVDPGER